MSDKKKRIENLEPDTRRMILWVTVVALTVGIFFIWTSYFKSAINSINNSGDGEGQVTEFREELNSFVKTAQEKIEEAKETFDEVKGAKNLPSSENIATTTEDLDNDRL